jgi:ferredoxin
VQYCTLCKKCIDICPTAALKWHDQSGAVQLLPELCTACGKCVEICPTHVILQSDSGVKFADRELPSRKDIGTMWLPVVCDLCDGSPACAAICPTDAITVDERKRIN